MIFWYLSDRATTAKTSPRKRADIPEHSLLAQTQIDVDEGLS